ncbi:MAG: ESX secretion-associated protein EspG, partial [Actinomycetota bacterium]|nr:ESX secretion-associated protein EspG [Actinomycetota bacterium]
VNSARGLDDGFYDTLSLLQRATVEYFGWIQDAKGPYSVLVAAAGRSGVLAERIDDKVTFERIDPDRLVDSFVFRLPNVPVGRGIPITTRATDYVGPTSQDVGGFRMSHTKPTQPPEARRLAELMRAPRVGGGKLYAAKRDHRGTRVRSANWLNVVDIAQQGRWLVYTTGRGEQSINAVPGTPQTIGTKLIELHRSLQ